MLKTIKNLLGLLGLGACCVTLAPSGAAAHGEKALEPFIRMRTIQWYDVQWSREKLNVNDELVITGKFHVAEDWPRGVPKPDATYLNVSSPGPVFIRTERYLNGQSSVSSAALKLGGDYDFKIVLKARLPGRYHLHPFFNLHDAGAVMGPGQWFEVAGDPAAFTNQVKTLNGDMIDMESYGLANGVAWHAFWIVLGSAWLLWWVRRPLFLPRYKMLQLGQEKALITPLDRKIAVLMLAGVPLFVFGAQAMTDRRYPQRHSASGRNGSDRAPARGRQWFGENESSAGGIQRSRPIPDYRRANPQRVGPAGPDRRIRDGQCAFS